MFGPKNNNGNVSRHLGRNSRETVFCCVSEKASQTARRQEETQLWMDTMCPTHSKTWHSNTLKCFKHSKVLLCFNTQLDEHNVADNTLRGLTLKHSRQSQVCKMYFHTKDTCHCQVDTLTDLDLYLKCGMTDIFRMENFYQITWCDTKIDARFLRIDNCLCGSRFLEFPVNSLIHKWLNASVPRTTVKARM